MPLPSSLRRVFYGRSELRAGWRLCVFLALVIALTNAGNLLGRALLRGADDDTVFLVREALDFLVFLLASWIMGRIEGRTIADYGLPWRAMFRVQFWQGVLVGIASVTGLLVAMRYALVFLLVALREEFRARGYALFTLSTGIGFWPAAILSAAFFGYSHHGNSGEDWIGLFNAGVFGLLACFLLRRTGNLWMPIGLHMAFDWSETYLYGVPNSGQTLPGHLLASTASGPAWLSGGTAGPEGSLLCSVLLGALWLIASRFVRRDNRSRFTEAFARRGTP